MSFNVVPKLAFTSALSVTTSLYYHTGLEYNVAFSLSSTTVTENVDSLPLPANLKKEIECLVQPVGDQIESFLREFRSALNGRVNLYKKLSWTSLGVIDYGRTVGNCISSAGAEFEDIEAFRLACGGSDPESIYSLWPIVKEKVTDVMSQSGWLVMTSRRFSLWYKTWVAYLSGQMKEFREENDFNDGTSDECFLFHLAVRQNNVGAARFFYLNKLWNIRGTRVFVLDLAVELVHRHRRKFNPSIFLLLVSYLNAEEIRELLHYNKNCLMHLVQWPLQQFVIPMAELIWPDFAFSIELQELIQRFFIRIMLTQVPLMYESIFKELWLKIPVDHQHVFFFNHTFFILGNLFKGHSPENVIRTLLKGESDAYQKFLHRFIPNPNAVLSMSIEDNKFLAFKNVLKQLFDEVDIVKDFEEVYAVYTWSYVNEYYGNDISSESFSDSE